MQPDIIEKPEVSSERLAHGFKRSLFGFPESFKRNSNQDTYGYLFETKSRKRVTAFSDTNRQLLENLGRQMIDEVGTDDAASEFSIIDAGYTYFGQFVDHDLTFDVDSSTSKIQNASKLINYRTPNLDLDSVYGDGPAVDVFMYDSQGLKFIVGNSNQFDLPRSTAGLAIIGDPRNDENLIVAQFHVSMLRFHNAVIDQLQRENPNLNHAELFRLAQSEVRRHYQWVVFHDYLRTIAGGELLDDVLKNGFKIFSPKKHAKFFMPVEFSVAAYRFGHSQIRDRYRFNSNFPNNGFFSAFSFTKSLVPPNWNIHWPSFFGTSGQTAANKARKIDTRVAMSMGNLPSAPGAPPNSIFTVLSARNLIRGMALGVPVGQYVTKKMSIAPLTSVQILTSPYQNPTPTQQSQHQLMIQSLQAENSELLNKTPLLVLYFKRG